MSERQIKEYYERIEKLLNGANKETYGFAPQEIKNILRSYEELQNQNQELKKQLEELKSTNKVLSEELTKDKILKQDCLTTCYGIPIGDIPKLINQQKEFIKYLEDGVQECNNYSKYIEKKVKELKQRSYGKTYIANEIMKNETAKKCLKEILSKYKSIKED